LAGPILLHLVSRECPPAAPCSDVVARCGAVPFSSPLFKEKSLAGRKCSAQPSAGVRHPSTNQQTGGGPRGWGWPVGGPRPGQKKRKPLPLENVKQTTRFGTPFFPACCARRAPQPPMPPTPESPSPPPGAPLQAAFPGPTSKNISLPNAKQKKEPRKKRSPSPPPNVYPPPFPSFTFPLP